LLQFLKNIFRSSVVHDLPSQNIRPEISESPGLPVDWEKGTPTSDIGPPGEEYERLFEAAVARSRMFDLYDGGIELSPGSILNKGSIKRVEAALRKFINDSLGGDATNLAVQCFTVCLNLVEDLKDVYRLEPVLTFGGVYGDRGRMFGIGLETLEAALSRGERAKNGGLDLHAWLTFPTGEIVDPTLLTTVAGYDIGIATGPRRLVYGHPRNLANLRYEPMIVGGELVHRLGMVRGYSFR